MLTISKLGEFGLIERFKKYIKTDSSVIKASGDDCAVLKLDKKRYRLFSCDMLVESVDFTLNDEPFLIGKKAISVSISDIASCGGVPRHCLISMGFPKRITLKFLDRIFKGMLSVAKKFSINIVGGDLSRSTKLIIDVSILGEVEKKYLTLRSQAELGDIIFVTGKLGGSIRGKHLNFTPRLKEARFLVKNFKINSMIDISDGLVQDLNHILEQSNKGAIIFEDLIPLSIQARNLNEALFMGEDFELLFTMPPQEAKKILKQDLGNFRPIGEIVEKEFKLILIDKRNKEKIIKPRGFHHF